MADARPPAVETEPSGEVGIRRLDFLRAEYDRAHGPSPKSEA